MEQTMTLGDYLDAAAMFTEKRKTMPILGSISLNGEIRATDLETSYRAEVSAPITGCIEPPQIKLLKAGICTKPLYSNDEFPTVEPEAEFGTHTFLTASELATVFKRAMVYSSRDVTRYNINGLCIDKKGSTPFIVATDGHRLYRAEFVSGGVIPGEQAILPNAGVSKLVKLLSKRPKKQLVSMSFSKDGLFARFGLPNETIWMRLVDGEFPDWRMVGAVSAGQIIGRLFVDRKKLLSQLETVATVCTDKNKAVKFYITGQGATMIASSPEFGEARASIMGDRRGKRKLVGLSARYVLEFLKSVPYEEVQIKFMKGYTPVFFSDGKPGTMESVCIMPMRFE